MSMRLLPITKDDFEAIVKETTERFGLPYNDDMRVMTISYFHSLDRTLFSFEPDQLGAFLHKAISNDMTYHIGQEIHQARQAEAKAKEATKLSVVESTST